MDCLRGSEWRRWDIHMHTPETQKNDHFIGRNSTEKWDRYYADILTYIGDGSDPQKAIAGLGVTDYFSIDNYNKIIYDGRLKDEIPFIFPNVELRMFPMAAQSEINVHCVFNPSFANKIENNFFSKLRWERPNGRVYSGSKTDLVSLGKDIKNNQALTDEQAFKVGIENFVITIDTFQEVFKDEELRENTIILMDNGTNTGVSAIGNPTRNRTASLFTALSDDLVRLSDIMLTATESDINRYLGEGSVSKEEIINKYGSLKPCLKGSDAHRNNAIFEPLDNFGNPTKRYSWIKADPTFNGLKQVICEPKDRVKICENKPDLKNDYQIIDRVVIDDKDFQKEEIFFNQNLTCIIGGRATGKSILLRTIAYNIDFKQVADKNEKVNPKLYYYTIPNLSVYWKDDNKTANTQRKITYIPQTYLNRLSDNFEEKTEIGELIESIILKDDAIKRINDTLKEKIRSIKNIINKHISDLMNKDEIINELLEQISELGKEDAIDKQLNKLVSQRNEIAKSNQCSEDDIKYYANYKKKLLNIENELSILKNDLGLIESICTPVSKNIDTSNISLKYREIIESEIDSEILEITKKWITKKQALLNEINASIQNKLFEIKSTEDLLKQLSPKIESSETVKILTQQIDSESKKLSKVKELAARLKNTYDEKESIIKKLISISGEFKTEYETYSSTLTKRFEVTGKEFTVNAFYKREYFADSFSEVFNKNILKNNNIDVESIKTNGLANPHYNFDDSAKYKFIKDIFTLEKGVKVKYNIEEAIQTVLADYYNISYGASVENDQQINQMSPGRKALLLLKLLIELDDSTNPILIDQPEDDLDNKSIFIDLVDFIKEKKKQRQIILVTHNANIAIGCDTEEIIIANQEGADSKNNHSKKFEYRSGSIENDEPRKDKSSRILAGILNQNGIQQQACNILEGGKEAFEIRKKKYVR